MARQAWQIIAIRCGTLDSTRSEMFAGAGGDLGAQRIDYYFWVLRRAGRTVLVDTGFSPDAAAGRGRTTTLPPHAALAALGIDGSWTGDVILTHAHWDHTGQLAALPRARILLARAEWRFWTSAASQRPEWRSLVDDRDLDALRRAHASGRTVFVEGTAEPQPGIRLIPAPGHTPGQLMVGVTASTGVVLLTSDAVHFDEELHGRRPFRHMVDLAESHASYELVDRLVRDGDADLVVAGHESGLLDRHPRLPGPLGPHAAVIEPDARAPSSRKADLDA